MYEKDASEDGEKRRVPGNGPDPVLGSSEPDRIGSGMVDEDSLTDDVIRDTKGLKVDWSREKSIPVSELKRKKKRENSLD